MYTKMSGFDRGWGGGGGALGTTEIKPTHSHHTKRE